MVASNPIKASTPIKIKALILYQFIMDIMGIMVTTAIMGMGIMEVTDMDIIDDIITSYLKQLFILMSFFIQNKIK